MVIAARDPSRALTAKPLGLASSDEKGSVCLRWQYQPQADDAAVLQQRLGAAFLVESAGVREELAGRPANPYELGLAGYRDCLALLDEEMPHVARRISQAQPANTDGH
jgi:hypothetical protein